MYSKNIRSIYEQNFYHFIKILINFDTKTVWVIYGTLEGIIVCVWFIFFHRDGLSRLQEVQDILKGRDQRSCVVNISWVLSAKFYHLRIWKCHVSPPKTKNSSRQLTKEKTIWYNVLHNDIFWYRILVGPDLKLASDEKILKIRRLLESKFFHLESSPWH